MENPVLDSNLSHNTDLAISSEIKMFLTETAKWAKFISIVGFIMIGFIVILALFMGVFMGNIMSSIPEAGPLGSMGGGFVAIIYLVMALIYVFPVLYLYRFATKMKVALKNNDQDFLSSSFENLKSCYKYMGILMAIALGFYAISFLSIIVLGGAAAFFR